jgi:hypothetical protein
MRTERSRTSGENFFDLFMAPSSQELEPPQFPGRFTIEFAESLLTRLKSARLLFTVDHTSSLRRLASQFEDEGNVGLATMLYATWAEHVLNHLVSIGLARQGKPDTLVKEVIREVSFGAKVSWLLVILGFTAIPKSHADRLRRLAELRNQFVHYKWTYEEPDKTSLVAKEGRQFLLECRPTFRYLATYRTRAALRGNAQRVKRISTSRSDALYSPREGP